MNRDEKLKFQLPNACCVTVKQRQLWILELDASIDLFLHREVIVKVIAMSKSTIYI